LSGNFAQASIRPTIADGDHARHRHSRKGMTGLAAEHVRIVTKKPRPYPDTILIKGAAGNTRPDVLNSFINGTKTSVKSYKTAKYEFEKEYLLHLLKLCGGKASEAAKLAGKSRTDFYELLRKHEIKIDEFKRTEMGLN